MISAIYFGAGCGQEESNVIADHLVKANLAGHDSHGVIRTPFYYQWMRDEKVFGNRLLEIVFETDTTTLVDGQLGFGQWIGKQAISVGIEKCRKQGVAVTAIRNAGHMGRIGHWSEMGAEAGFVAIHFVNTSGLGMHCLPAGGKDKRLSVNPISIGVPREDQPPLVFDIAAAATAEGKIKVARNKGVAVPAGWITDGDGNPTTDPRDLYDEETGAVIGAILPLAGHKGYALSFMIELLAGALTGGGASAPGITRLEQGMLSILIDPDKIGTREYFNAEVQRYVEFVKSSRPQEDGGEVLVPGDMEQRNRAKRLAEGIDLDENTWHQLVDTAKATNVDQDLIDTARHSVIQ